MGAAKRIQRQRAEMAEGETRGGRRRKSNLVRQADAEAKGRDGGRGNERRETNLVCRRNRVRGKGAGRAKS